ncbi:MAG: LysM peptidoglycan-binding domain-containing protein [Deltaproteobacteria bacterium]|nr:LysM peptidoglycan-binding domain-containing protein [Deltaproteobacteria bacterium]
MFARRLHLLALSIVVLISAVPAPPAHGDETHVVAAGETLWGIAQQHDVSVDALRQANDLGDSDRILPGQRLHLPEAEGTAAVESVAPPEPAPLAPPCPFPPGPTTRPERPTNNQELPSSPLSSPSSLSAFFRALQRVQDDTPGALARIAHFGDSHTASPSFPGSIRLALTARFGDAGPGFIQPGRPWRSYDPQDIDVGASGDWTFDRVRRTGDDNLADGLYGLGGWSARTSKQDAEIWLATESGESVSGFDVEYLAQPDGGSADVLLDGAVVARIDSDSDGIAAERHRLQAEDAEHRLEIRAVGDGEFRLLGVETARPGPGVLYDVLATNGARADWLLSWNGDLFSDCLARRDPDLVVLMFGTNEASDSDLDLDRFSADFARVLELLHTSAPDASCLVLAPPDMSERRHGRYAGTPEILPPLVEAERSAATAAGCAFFDTFAAMGGSGAMDRWVAADPSLGAADHVHLTSRGYRTLGEAVAAALLDAFDAWSSGDSPAVAPPEDR